MNSRRALSAALVGVMSSVPFRRRAMPRPRTSRSCRSPSPGVPQIMTMEGKFVRVAYNNEGYVILGYQASNRSVGEEWMLLEVGMTVLDNAPDYRLTRDALSLETPDGKTLPLPSIIEQREGNPRAIHAAGERPARFHQLLSVERATARAASASFPTWGLARCRRTRWISAPTAPVSAVSISRSPAASRYGQHWLNVKFQNSLVRVPFRILTEDEEKLLSKNYKSIEKQVKEAFKPKK